MPAAYTNLRKRDQKAQLKLDAWNDANTENGHCPPLLVSQMPFVPVASIANNEQYVEVMAENRRREEYNFSSAATTAVKKHVNSISPGLYEKILAPLLSYQRTAYVCLAYYQLTGKVYNGNDSTKIRLPKDPNGIFPPGCRLPALIQLPTAAGKTWIIGSAAVGPKTLVVVPNGGIRGGYREALERQYAAMGIEWDFRVLDPTRNRRRVLPTDKVIPRIDGDSAYLQNDCRLFVTTYQALKDPETLALLFSTYGKHSPIEQIIIDEGHHSAAHTYECILRAAYNANPDVHVVYFTALLDRLDQQYLRHIRVHSMPLGWARESGIVADIRLTSLEYDVDQILIIKDGEVQVENVVGRKRKAKGDKGKAPATREVSDESDAKEPSHDSGIGMDWDEEGVSELRSPDADDVYEARVLRSAKAAFIAQLAVDARLRAGLTTDVDDGNASLDMGGPSGSGSIADDPGIGSDYFPSDYSKDFEDFDMGSDSEYEPSDPDHNHSERSQLDDEDYDSGDDASSEGSGNEAEEPDSDDDEEEVVESKLLTDQQSRIAAAFPDQEDIQKHMIKLSIACLVNRAKESRTYIALMFACRDQEHARNVRIWVDQVIGEHFASLDENWKSVLRAELVVTKLAPPLPLTPEPYPGRAADAHDNVREGRSNIVVQVFMYSEGVDIVPIKIVTFLCPRSKHIAYQILGRGLRLFRFNDDKHNGRWFNPDPEKTKSMMHWSSCFKGQPVVVNNQFELIRDNKLDIFVPECFDMQKDFKALDDTIDFTRRVPAPEGLIVSGGVRAAKKRKTQIIQLNYSGVGKDVRDLKGKAVEGVSSAIPVNALDGDLIARGLAVLDLQIEKDSDPESKSSRVLKHVRGILAELGGYGLR